jgi:hypothetical protein
MLRRHLIAAPLLGAAFPAAAQTRPRAPRPAEPEAPPPAAPPLQPWHGANVVQAENAPLGGAEARRAMRLLGALGADSVALTPYLWQPMTDSTDVVRGGDTPDSALAAGIIQARGLGLRVLVKPHLWVNNARPGEARMADDAAWRRWFSSYTAALVGMARTAQEAGAEAFSVATAIRAANTRPEWRETIAAVRAVFRGRLLMVAADSDDAETFPHWPLLDAVGLRIFRPLGADDGGTAWVAPMGREIERIDRLEQRFRKRVWVAELGIRSAAGAAANPGLTVEERASLPDQRVQAEALARWLRRLERPSVEAVLLWRWLSDATSGGPSDTDFTPQGKLAEGVLLHAWLAR